MSAIIKTSFATQHLLFGAMDWFDGQTTVLEEARTWNTRTKSCWKKGSSVISSLVISIPRRKRKDPKDEIDWHSNPKTNRGKTLFDHECRQDWLMLLEQYAYIIIYCAAQRLCLGQWIDLDATGGHECTEIREKTNGSSLISSLVIIISIPRRKRKDPKDEIDSQTNWETSFNWYHEFTKDWMTDWLICDIRKSSQFM